MEPSGPLKRTTMMMIMMVQSNHVDLRTLCEGEKIRTLPFLPYFPTKILQLDYLLLYSSIYMKKIDDAIVATPTSDSIRKLRKRPVDSLAPDDASGAVLESVVGAMGALVVGSPDVALETKGGSVLVMLMDGRLVADRLEVNTGAAVLGGLVAMGLGIKVGTEVVFPMAMGLFDAGTGALVEEAAGIVVAGGRVNSLQHVCTIPVAAEQTLSDIFMA